MHLGIQSAQIVLFWLNFPGIPGQGHRSEK